LNLNRTDLIEDRWRGHRAQYRACSPDILVDTFPVSVKKKLTDAHSTPRAGFDMESAMQGGPETQDPISYSGISETDNSDRLSSCLSAQSSYVQLQLENKLFVCVPLIAVRVVHVDVHQCEYPIENFRQNW